MSEDEALLDSGFGARKSYILGQDRNGPLCSSFVVPGLRESFECLLQFAGGGRVRAVTLGDEGFVSLCGHDSTWVEMKRQ
jgi:hypothetical protein